jgi:hypothetical protein
MSKRFFPEVLLIVGDENYKQVIAKYRDIYSNHDLPKNPILQWHLIEGILPGLASYQILRENGKSQESVLAMIDQTFEILFSEKLAKMKKLGILRFVYPFLRLYIKPAMR